MIRLKIILLVLVSIVVLSAIMYTVSTTIILKSYHSIEDTETHENLVRVQGAVENYNTALNIKLRDWAQWDDSYAFIQDGNSEYVESNLNSETLVNLEINVMLFIDTAHKIVFSKMVDLQSEEETNPNSFAQKISLEEKIISHSEPDSSVGGIIKVDNQIFLFQSLPIVQSDGTGPVGGTIIFGKLLDQEMIERFGKLTRLHIDFFLNDELALPADIVEVKRELTFEDSHTVKILSEENIAGYLQLYDTDEVPVGVLRITMPREIHTQGKVTLTSFIIIASSSILLFGIIIIIFIEKLLITRFTRLSKEVASITSLDDLSNAKVNEGKNDDIGKLAQKINNMLAHISSAQEKEKVANKQEQLANEKLQTQLEDTKKINKLMVDREIKMIQLKKEIEDLKQKIEKK